MPRLIVQRSSRRQRKVPPCGRLIEYKEPHSPFQKLVDDARRRYSLSGRDLAARIGVSQSTLWIWLHNVNGFPHPKSFDDRHVIKLSRVLKIPASKIRSTLDSSRHIFTPHENPVPQESVPAMQRFIEILENDKRQTISKAYVLNLAKNLHAGTKRAAVVIAISLLLAFSVRADDLVTTRSEERRVGKECRS